MVIEPKRASDSEGNLWGSGLVSPGRRQMAALSPVPFPSIHLALSSDCNQELNIGWISMISVMGRVGGVGGGGGGWWMGGLTQDHGGRSAEVEGWRRQWWMDGSPVVF